MDQVWFVLLDGFDLFETSAAMHCFALANEELRLAKRTTSYEVRVFATAVTPVRSSGEVTLKASVLPSALAQPPDRLIVAGGGIAMHDLRSLSTEQMRLVDWISRRHRRIRRLASIGGDAFVILQAAIGRLPGAVSWCGANPVPVQSGMDLALGMIARDKGQHVAVLVAQRLAPSADRINALFRFRSKLTGDGWDDERVLALNGWIAEHLRQPLTNERLARRIAMSPRTFARFYLRATGITPARAVEQIRLEHACRVMETTPMSLKAIALRSGFSSEEVMRRAFVRVLKMSPTAYRRIFFGDA